MNTGGRTSGRQEAKAATRQRLVDAAVRILDEEGEVALTTTNVTRLAGIAQSSFYVHFVDVDDLLHEVVEQLGEELDQAARTARRLAGSRPNDRERLRDTFRVPLRAIVAHPAILRLLVRSRLDRTTPLGEWSRAMAENSRRTLVADLRAAGVTARTPPDRRRLEMYAEGVVALVETFALGHVAGAYPDLEEIVDMLLAFARMPRVGGTQQGPAGNGSPATARQPEG